MPVASEGTGRKPFWISGLPGGIESHQAWAKAPCALSSSAASIVVAASTRRPQPLTRATCPDIDSTPPRHTAPHPNSVSLTGQNSQQFCDKQPARNTDFGGQPPPMPGAPPQPAANVKSYRSLMLSAMMTPAVS